MLEFERINNIYNVYYNNKDHKLYYYNGEKLNPHSSLRKFQLVITISIIALGCFLTLGLLSLSSCVKYTFDTANLELKQGGTFSPIFNPFKLKSPLEPFRLTKWNKLPPKERFIINCEAVEKQFSNDPFYLNAPELLNRHLNAVMGMFQELCLYHTTENPWILRNINDHLDEANAPILPLLIACFEAQDEAVKAYLADHFVEELLYKESYKTHLIKHLSARSSHVSTQQLFAAAFNNQPERIVQCIKAGIDPYTENIHGLNIFEIAAVQGNVEALEKLLSLGEYEFPLSTWLKITSPEILKVLIKYRILPIPKSNEDLISLAKHFTLQAHCHEVWEAYLIEFLHKYPNALNATSSDGKTYTEFLFEKTLSDKKYEGLFAKLFVRNFKLDEKIFSLIEERALVFQDKKWLFLLPKAAQEKLQKESAIHKLKPPRVAKRLKSDDKIKKTAFNVAKIKGACEPLKKQFSNDPNYLDKPELLKQHLDLIVSLFMDLCQNHITIGRELNSSFNQIENLLKGDKRDTILPLLRACFEAQDEVVKVYLSDHFVEQILYQEYKLSIIFIPFSTYSYGGNLYPLVRFLSVLTSYPSYQQLFAAAFTNQPEKIESCLKAGINPYLESVNGVNVFDIAAVQRNPEALDKLLEYCEYVFPTSIWLEVTSSEVLKVLKKHNQEPLPKNQKELISLALHFNALAYCSEEGEGYFIEFLKRYPQALNLPLDNGKSFVENLFIKTLSDPKKEPLFFKIFVNNSFNLNPKILSAIEERVLINNEKKWLLLFPKAKQEELEKILNRDPLDPIKRMKELVTLLKKELKKKNLHPENIDSELIVEAHLLKKKIKSDLKNQADESLKREFEDFVKIYDQVVERHPIFNHLRFISKAIRKGQLGFREARKFIDLWRGREVDEKGLQAFWREDSLLIRKKMVKALKAVSNLPIRSRWIQLAHGTNTQALPIILKLGKLTSSGVLFEMNVAPLTGEGTGALPGGINVKGISTVNLDYHLEQCYSEYFDYSTRLLLAKSYATRLNQNTGYGNPRPLTFDSEKEYGIFEKCCEDFLQNKIRFEARFWFDFKRAILRLKQTNNQKFKEMAPGWLQKLSTHKVNPKIDEILALFEKPSIVVLDPEDPLIKKPIPLLFASSTFNLAEKCVSPICVSSHWRDHDKPVLTYCDEVIINRPLQLESDLDFVFTDELDLEVIQKQFLGKKIKVLPFDVAHILQTRQIAFFNRIDYSKVNSKDFVRVMGQQFQRDVLPFYAESYPTHPHYRQQGTQIALHNPFYGHKYNDYAAYIKDVEEGNNLPRVIHGAMHATRTALFSYMLYNLYVMNGYEVDVPPHFLIFAAGMHDAGRQDEGVDRWDEDSAFILRAYLQRQHFIFDQKEAEIAYHALAEKDPKNRVFTSSAQEIVQSSDCLEIHRCLYQPDTQFDKSRLSLMRKKKLAAIAESGLIVEVRSFIKMTEHFGLKKLLEDNSSNYFQDLLYIFCQLNKEDQFKLMATYLAPLLVERPSSEIGAEIDMFLSSLKI